MHCPFCRDKLIIKDDNYMIDGIYHCEACDIEAQITQICRAAQPVKGKVALLNLHQRGMAEMGRAVMDLFNGYEVDHRTMEKLGL